MKRSSKILALFLLFTALASGKARAEETCSTEAADIKAISNFTQSLRIALSQGDVTEMQDLVTKNYAGKLASCSRPTLKVLCDISCFDAIGQYYLFMSNEIAYYYSKNDSNKTIATADELQSYVNEGMKVVNTAKEFLEENGASAGASGGYRAFVIDTTRFDILKIRLYMATGDNWYQSMSEQWLKRLDSMIAAVVEEPNGSSASSSALAVTNYEEALWTLTETMMGIPDDPSFASFAKELVVLNDEINRRIESVNNGYLYIGIDPMANSFRSVADLKADLKEVTAKVAEIEGKVETNLESWLKAKQNQQFEDLNTKANNGELSVSLSSYKIAKIETEANALNNLLQEEGSKIATAVSKLQNDATAQQAEFELTTSKIQIQFELQKRLKEINDRLTLLQGKKELDALNFKEGRLQQDIENLKWIMNWDIAKTNLDLQKSSYETQKAGYLRELASNSYKRSQALFQVEQLKTSIKELETASSSSDNDKKKYEDQQTNIGKDQLAAAKAEICNLEDKIARFGGSPATPLADCGTVFEGETSEIKERAAICSVKQELAKLSADDQAITLKCGLGLEGLSEDAVARLSKVSCEGQRPAEMQTMLETLNALG